MATFEIGDVIRVPFPYADRDTRQRRPALVVATDRGDDGRLLWVLMVTSAEHRPWPGDVALADAYARAGLRSPSIIRTAKIATIEADVAGRLGRVEAHVLQSVFEEVRLASRPA